MFPQRLPRFGETRSAVGPRHALLAPDGFVPNPLPGWRGAAGVVAIASPLALGGGAAFTMTLLSPLAGSDAAPSATLPIGATERFAYVMAGTLGVGAEARGGAGDEAELAAGDYAFLPAGRAHRFEGSNDLRAVLFEKRYRPAAYGKGGETGADGETNGETTGEASEGADEAAAPPPFVHGALDAVDAVPFEGNERLRVRTLLPADPAFDVAVNVMEFEPGAALPLVETHVNEHGLYMLSGGGIYRLEDAWYPVATGDVIWMGPHCPQWFGALGDETARYLLYKDVNRDDPAL